MKFYILLSSIILFSIGTNAQSVLITPNKMESKQNSALDNLILQSNNQPNIIGKRHNGTTAAPTAVVTDDDLLTLQAAGYNGTAFTGTRGSIRFEANQNWTANNNGTKIKFLTTANGSVNLTERMVIADDGKIGIGITPTSYNLDILSNSDAGMGIHRFGGDAPGFFGISARGTTSAPTETLNGDILVRIGGKGYDGVSETSSRARIEMVANEDWTTTANGTDMKFFTTWAGQTTAEEKVVIRGSGNVGIGSIAPESKLTVNGDVQMLPEKFVHSSTTTLIALNRNGKSVIRFGGTGNVHLKGIGGGVDGLVIHIYSIRGENPTLGNDKILTIHNDSPDANLENRILTGEPYVGIGGVGENITISNEGGATLIYDGTANRWRVIGVQK